MRIFFMAFQCACVAEDSVALIAFMSKYRIAQIRVKIMLTFSGRSVNSKR